MGLIYYVMISMIVGLIALLIAVPIMLRPSVVERRIQEVAGTTRTDASETTTHKSGFGKVLAFVSSIRSLMGLSDDEKLRQRFLAGGIRPDLFTDGYFVVRLLAPIAGTAFRSRLGDNAVLASLIFAFLGYMLPDSWLS